MKKISVTVVLAAVFALSVGSAIASTNIALGKPVTSSSIEKSSLTPDLAVDGDSSTRWSSEFSDHNWITVDLQARYQLTDVKLYWQNSYSKDYDIKVSDDGVVWNTVESVVDSDGGLDEISLAGGQGRFVRVEGYRRATRWGHSLWELEIYGHPVVENISRNKPVSASSIEKNTLAPEYAVDGELNTRWSSDFTDHNWIEVDLGAEHQVTQVKLQWQNSYSKDYEVQTSYDGETWTTIRREEDSDGGLDDLMVQGHGRYLRIEGFRRATRWGHSLWELEVYGYATSEAADPDDDSTAGDTGSDDGGAGDDGDDDVPADTQAPTVPGSLSVTELSATAVELTWNASSDDTQVLSYEVYRNGARLTELLAPITALADNSLQPGVSYDYAVRAVDAAGNWSNLSASVQVTLDVQDSAYVVDGAVLLEWSTPDQRENGDYLELDEIAGYELRYKAVSDSEAQTIVIDDATATSYETGHMSGTYEFSVAVFDTNGLYSQFVALVPVQY